MWWRRIVLVLSIVVIMSPLYRGGDIALPLSAQLFIRSVLCLCVLSVYRAGGQTRDVDLMPGYRWLYFMRGYWRRRWSNIKTT